MKNKYFAFIITFAVVLCTFCTSLTALANTTEPVGEAPEVEVTTNLNPGGLVDEEENTTVRQETTKNNAPIIIETKDDNTTTTKKKVTVVTTTKRNNTNTNATTRRNTQAAEPTIKVTETTDTTLPDGQFYVHLVLGNGEADKKFLMKEAGKVTAPQEPEWEGYVFDGWYSDEKFTKPWDFEKDEAKEEMTIYAKWSVDVASILYTITVSEVQGGKVLVEPDTAAVDTTVIITIKPDVGKRLVEGSLTINGKRSDMLSFKMPAENVVISASFEDVPEVAEVEEKDNSFIFVLLGAGVLAVILIVAGVVILRRRNDVIVPEFDENGAVIIDDDDDVWIDESLVIEDAFPIVKREPAEVVPDDEDVIEAEEDENEKKLTEALNEEQKDGDTDIDFSLFE